MEDGSDTGDKKYGIIGYVAFTGGKITDRNIYLFWRAREPLPITN